MPHAFRHLLLRQCLSRGHKEDYRATPPSQPRSRGRQGHTRLEKRRGPSPAAPAGRQGLAEVPLQEEALCWGHTCQPTGWPEGGGTPLGCAEACLFQKCLTDGLPRWLGGNTPAVEEAGDTQVGPLDGESPRSRTRQPTPLS